VSVCLSVCHKPVLYQNVESRKQRHTIAQESSFLLKKISAKFQWDPNGDAKIELRNLISAILDQYVAISQKLCKMGTYVIQISPGFADSMSPEFSSVTISIDQYQSIPSFTHSKDMVLKFIKKLCYRRCARRNISVEILSTAA